jgi:hypothetical protein
VLRDATARLADRIQTQLRMDDDKALRLLVDAGVVPVALPRTALTKAAGEAAASLDGKEWSQAWRLRVEAAAADAHKRRSK